MNVLNKDCLALIGQSLDFSDIYNLSKTCKKNKEVFDKKSFWFNKLENDYSITLPMNKDLRKYYYYLSHKTPVIQACKNGDLEILKYFYNKSIESFHKIQDFNAKMVDFFTVSVKYGHLNIIDFLIKIIGDHMGLFLISTIGMRDAIQLSNVELVDYFVHKNVKITQAMIRMAAEKGNLEITKLITDNYKSDSFTLFKIRKEAAVLAKKKGHKEVADYLEGYYYHYFVLILLLFLYIHSKIN